MRRTADNCHRQVSRGSNMRYFNIEEYQNKLHEKQSATLLVYEGFANNTNEILKKINVEPCGNEYRDIETAFKYLGVELFRLLRGEYFIAFGMNNTIYASLGNTFSISIYYYLHKKKIVFCDSIQDIPDLYNRLQPFERVSYTGDHEQHPVFKDVNMLRYGEYVQFDFCNIDLQSFPMQSPLNTEVSIFNEEEARRKIFSTLSNVIQEKIANSSRVVVLVSGGIDSSAVAYLASLYASNLELYSIGTKKSNEFIYANKIADYLKLPLHRICIAEEEYREALHNVTQILEHSDSTIIEYMIPEFIAYKHIARPGDVFLSGYGSDILFGGFNSKSAFRTSELILSEFKSVQYSGEMSKRFDDYFSVRTIYPYFDYRFLDLAFSISSTLKTRYGIEKYILRKAFENVLPHCITWRKKIGIHQSTGCEDYFTNLVNQSVHDFSDLRLEKNRLAYKALVRSIKK